MLRLVSQRTSRCLYCATQAIHVPTRLATVRFAHGESSPAAGAATTSRDRRAAGPKIDEEIPYRFVQLVDPETSSLRPPAPLYRVLDALDRSRFAVQLVDESNPRAPVCRILDKSEEYKKAKAKKAALKTNAAAATGADGDAPAAVRRKVAPGATKEIQVTWNVSDHDLSHKLGRAKEFLSKGYKVLLVIAAKRGGQPMTKAARVDKAKQIEKELSSNGRLNRQETLGVMWKLNFDPIGGESS